MKYSLVDFSEVRYFTISP